MAAVFDAAGENPANYFLNEQHILNVSVAVWPDEGPFYLKDLKVVATMNAQGGGGTRLLNIYEDFTLSPSHLKYNMQCAGEVFSYLIITRPNVEAVNIDYRASGAQLDTALQAEINSAGTFDKLDPRIWGNFKGQFLGVPLYSEDPNLRHRTFLETIAVKVDDLINVMNATTIPNDVQDQYQSILQQLASQQSLMQSNGHIGTSYTPVDDYSTFTPNISHWGRVVYYGSGTGGINTNQDAQLVLDSGGPWAVEGFWCSVMVGNPGCASCELVAAAGTDLKIIGTALVDQVNTIVQVFWDHLSNRFIVINANSTNFSNYDNADLVATNSARITQHIANSYGAHASSAISHMTTGNQSTNVKNYLNTVGDSVNAHINATASAHDSSAIKYGNSNVSTALANIAQATSDNATAISTVGNTLTNHLDGDTGKHNTSELVATFDSSNRNLDTVLSEISDGGIIGIGSYTAFPVMNIANNTPPDTISQGGKVRFLRANRQWVTWGTYPLMDQWVKENPDMILKHDDVLNEVGPNEIISVFEDIIKVQAKSVIIAGSGTGNGEYTGYYMPNVDGLHLRDGGAGSYSSLTGDQAKTKNLVEGSLNYSYATYIADGIKKHKHELPTGEWGSIWGLDIRGSSPDRTYNGTNHYRTTSDKGGDQNTVRSAMVNYYIRVA